MLPVTRALISVHDKRGVTELASALTGLGVEIVSSGGTERHLREAGVPVTAVSALTSFPEMLDGRVKTLHPRIHAGILADRAKPEHLETLVQHGIGRIDLVVVNLYPFESTIARAGVTEAESVEMIDIGGPAMVRAAAKNFGGVGVVVDPDDYEEVRRVLESGDRSLPAELRRRLAGKAFAHTARYDSAVASWFARTGDGGRFPGEISLPLRLELLPRYGENPHQEAGVYRIAGGNGLLGGMSQLQGKELSWNNLLDADAARKLVALFDEAAVVIVKHNNPCGVGRSSDDGVGRSSDTGVGRGGDLVEAYARAFDSDPVSAFGGILATNRNVTADLVDAFGDLFLEVLVAPSFDEAALAKLATRKNLRVLRCPLYDPARDEIELRGIDGGFLAQTPDAFADDPSGWTCPSRRQPTPEQRRALEFAWKVARYTKSNAIVITNEHQTLGVGAGQMSRVDSCRMAIQKSRFPLSGSVAASDAFFPFRDGLDVLAQAGVEAIVQPGGSKRDDELLAAADEQALVMMLTGRRHFRH